MSSFETQIHAATIVLRGAFNPKIFHPEWFVGRGLLSEQESEAAEVDLVHDGAAVFSADWLRIEALRDRFSASTSNPGHLPMLRDLVMGTFGVLKHTPCTAIGLNRMFHVKLENRDVWHKLGDKLAPKELWNSLMTADAKQLDRKSVGLLSLSVLGSRPDATRADGLTITIGPSTELSDGVFFSSNEHYSIASGQVSDAVEVVATAFQGAMHYSEELLRRVVQSV